MRVAVLAITAAAALASPGYSQEVVTGWAGKLFAAASADGRVPSGHDFGSVPRGAQLKHRFPIKNIYAVPLTIAASVSCGCVSVTPNPPTLQPLESGFLDINMDTLRFFGHKSVSVYVTVMNQQYSSTTTLQVVGHCRGDITLEPGQASFGMVAAGQPSTKEVIVRYAGQQPFQITGPASGNSPAFDVAVAEAYRQVGQVGYRVSVKLKPNAPAGSYKGDLNLATNDPGSPLLPIPYDAMVQAALTASPPETKFGAVKGADLASRKMIVRSGGRPFKVLGVDGQDAALTVEFGQAANPTQILTIKLANAPPGPFQRTLTIKTDLDGGATVTARVEATVQ